MTADHRPVHPAEGRPQGLPDDDRFGSCAADGGPLSRPARLDGTGKLWCDRGYHTVAAGDAER